MITIIFNETIIELLGIKLLEKERLNVISKFVFFDYFCDSFEFRDRNSKACMHREF